MSPSFSPRPFTMMTSFFAGDDGGAVKCCVALTFRRDFSSTSKPFGTLLWNQTSDSPYFRPVCLLCLCWHTTVQVRCAAALSVCLSVCRSRVVTRKKCALEKKDLSRFGLFSLFLFAFQCKSSQSSDAISSQSQSPTSSTIFFFISQIVHSRARNIAVAAVALVVVVVTD